MGFYGPAQLVRDARAHGVEVRPVDVQESAYESTLERREDGEPALRLGWMYGPEHVVDALNRIRGPFNSNTAAIAAGIAAMEDTAHQERSREHNTRWLKWLTDEIGKLGLEVTPSVANFVLIHFPQVQGRTAEEANAFLMKRGLILRQTTAYKLPNALRLSVGTEEANRLVVAALKEFLR